MKRSEPITRPFPVRSQTSNGGSPASPVSPLEKAEMARRDFMRGKADETNRDLPAYRESDSEITANTSGLHAKGIPREAWRWIGVGIALFITCLGVAVVVALL
jgi:hypothetical protein